MSRFFSVLNLTILVFFLSTSTVVCAQESAPKQANEAAKEAPKNEASSPVTEKASSAEAISVAKPSPKAEQVLPDPKAAATKSFDSEKETRLESLRYKHLWIAYSMVWIVIFVFIRQTWQRSQAVSRRLEELKSRLIALEEKEK